MICHNKNMDKKGLFEGLLKAGKIIAPAVITKTVYDKMFNHHFYRNKDLTFSLEDFPNLIRIKQKFKSGNNTLIGYIYADKTMQNRGIFVFCHGYGGGGHHCYLDLINQICKRGYLVFGYDATANDESDGEIIKGFTQGYIDADKAISYIENKKEFKDLPLYVMGHSWGAYSSSCAIGNHKRIKGLIAFSGFNSATTIFKANGEKYAGKQANDFMIYVNTYEKLLFGDKSKVTAIDSFKKSKAKIVIVHSKDDMTVPIEAGLNIYKKEFKNDKRFKFITLLDRGHGTVYYTLEGRRYYEDIQKKYQKIIKDDELNKDDEMNKIMSREKYNNLIDEKLLDKCLRFITK